MDKLGFHIDPTPIPAAVLAQRWGWTTDRVVDWCAAGILPAKKIRGQWFVSTLELIRWGSPQENQDQNGGVMTAKFSKITVKGSHSSNSIRLTRVKHDPLA